MKLSEYLKEKAELFEGKVLGNELLSAASTALALEADNARLRAALEYYANSSNYEGFAMGYEWVGGGSIELDKGARARKALEKGEGDGKA